MAGARARTLIGRSEERLRRCPGPLALGTWSEDPAYNNQKIDIEFSCWKNALNSSHSWRWTNRSIAFQSSAFGNSLAQWSYTRRNGIPKPGGETPRINLWLFRGAPPSNGLPVEVIISKFEFVP